MAEKRVAHADTVEAHPEWHGLTAEELRDEMEAPFIRNEHGLWCPQCGEMIADWEWIGDCDACGYPTEIEDYDYDDY